MWQAMLRILVADDVPMVRAGLKSLLETHEGWSVCGEAGDGRDAVQKALDLTPDVVLLDVSMPHLNGLQAAEIIKKYLPSAAIYFVTQYHSLEWRGPRQKSARVAASRRFIYPQAWCRRSKQLSTFRRLNSGRMM